MSTRNPSWELYRSFLAVVGAGSLSAAARSLGLSQPTVGRHIEALERELDAVLFTRSPGGLRPTEAALALRPHAEVMAAAAQALVRTASGGAGEVRGTVRLTASELVGAEVLPAMLAGFRELHPGVDIELALTNEQEDLLRRDADIAVRMARPTQSALLARRIGSVRLALYAHKTYLARHGAPASLADLAGHSVIGFDRIAPPTAIARGLGMELTRDLFALRTDSDLAQLAALRAGFGLCACQPVIADRSGELQPVLRDAFAFELEVWVAMHEDLKAVHRMRLMFDHLVAGLTAYVRQSALLTGAAAA
ncbi:MAG TPA: LysR family transcriptional regulator [Caulobacteraceae bacterium]